jgi:hypothetical protein
MRRRTAGRPLTIGRVTKSLRPRSGSALSGSERSRITDVPEYLAPGVYVEETSYRSKSIEGVSTGARGLVGSIRRGVDPVARAVAVVAVGVLLGVAASIAVDRARRRRRRIPRA